MKHFTISMSCSKYEIHVMIFQHRAYVSHKTTKSRDAAPPPLAAIHLYAFPSSQAELQPIAGIVAREEPLRVLCALVA
jgi:hypothetical protein